MRRALIVGIDDYPDCPLCGCVNDANRIGEIVSRNADGSPNFDCKYILAPPAKIDRRTLAQAVEELFATEADVTVFYFSGHGAIDVPGGYLMTPDAKVYSDGYAMRDLLVHAIKSPVRETVVILDCCHSGEFGNLPEVEMGQALLREGIAVLAASRSYESSMEVDGAGVFATLVYDALSGGAADILGRVTVGSIYAYVDMALSAWDQRPVFKAHLSKFTPLRQCKPHVDAAILRLLPTYFERPDYELPLDPSYEPDMEPKDEKNERTFAHLQKLRDARLLVPVGEKHLYYAAVNSKACKLTTLGRFYWQLAEQGRI
jgi:hypothetical protein